MAKFIYLPEIRCFLNLETVVTVQVKTSTESHKAVRVVFAGGGDSTLEGPDAITLIDELIAETGVDIRNDGE